ncbi:MAG: sulfur carrier protein ThiS [Lachnospiraceae bacterium]|nr:sulfur carrier protein ThiS [Lachnospiraceae bacterium]
MITVNGKEFRPEKPVTVAEYLEKNRYKTNRIAVELNYEILPKSVYASTFLKDGDILEIVSFVGGG